MLPSSCTVSVQVKFPVQNFLRALSGFKVVKFSKVAHSHVTTVDIISLVDMEQALGVGGDQ